MLLFGGTLGPMTSAKTEGPARPRALACQKELVTEAVWCCALSFKANGRLRMTICRASYHVVPYNQFIVNAECIRSCTYVSSLVGSVLP